MMICLLVLIMLCYVIFYSNHSMLRKYFLLFAVMLSVAAQVNGRVKYVFYFIGDGMGVNQVNVTETYLAALKGRIGFEPILMSGFPVVGLVNTYSGTNGVTDSAAGGTALATGHKTKNGALGLTTDLQTEVSSVAAWAKDAGAAVGVATSVAIDHATPASFYAHVPDRKMYYDIGRQLIASGYDYFGGSDFHEPDKKPEERTLYEQAERAGYTVAKGYKDYTEKASSASKMILLQSDEANKKFGHDHIPYALDRREGDLSLEEITRAGIDFLTKCGKDGFFFMVEGGMIDYACHKNDIGAAINEVLDMDKAIKAAYEFYSQHPDETIIVVSADHETGGLVMGRGPYELHTDLLRFQKMSKPEFQWRLNDLYSKSPEQFTWSLVEKELKTNFGFWDGITLTDDQTTRLKKRWTAIEKAIGEGQKVNKLIDNLGDTACRILSEVAMISWASGGHSNGYVPVYAIGPGTEVFQGRIDNIEIAPAIGTIAGWTSK